MSQTNFIYNGYINLWKQNKDECVYSLPVFRHTHVHLTGSFKGVSSSIHVWCFILHWFYLSSQNTYIVGKYKIYLFEL